MPASKAWLADQHAISSQVQPRSIPLFSGPVSTLPLLVEYFKRQLQEADKAVPMKMDDAVPIILGIFLSATLILLLCTIIPCFISKSQEKTDVESPPPPRYDEVVGAEAPPPYTARQEMVEQGNGVQVEMLGLPSDISHDDTPVAERRQGMESHCNRATANADVSPIAVVETAHVRDRRLPFGGFGTSEESLEQRGISLMNYFW